MSEVSGWTNWQTKTIYDWFNPETVEDVENARGYIEEKLLGLDEVLSDLIETDKINWDELLEAVEANNTEEEEEEEDTTEEDFEWENCCYVVLLMYESLIEGQPFETLEEAQSKRDFWNRNYPTISPRIFKLN